MLWVLLAAIPAIAVHCWFFGYGLLLSLLFCTIIGLTSEALCLRLRHKPIRTGLTDNSTLVTALLFAVTVPPGTPWWLLMLGMIFAIALVKHAYGGLGHNVFNPAMAGYLFLLLAFPLAMSRWQLPDSAITPATNSSPLDWLSLNQSLGFVFPPLRDFMASITSVLRATLDLTTPSLSENSQELVTTVSSGNSSAELATVHSANNLISGSAGKVTEHKQIIDGLAMATPLAETKMGGTSALLKAYDQQLPPTTHSVGTGLELANLAWLAGGLLLLGLRIISWHIPLAIIGTVVILSVLFDGGGSADWFNSLYWHLFGSATMVGAFFIATDPVSAATSNTARLLYGLLIGCCIYGIRVWSSYPDSVAIAVLFANFCAPLLDYWCRPRKPAHNNIRFPK